MRLRSTSTQRTYRYVRIGLLVVVVAIGIAVAIQLASGVALASISATYYTPGRSVFVGGLCAVALALLALSGHSLEQALLDLAAVLAPVIALVPVPASAAAACPDGRCLPAAALADLDAGMLTLAILAPVVLAAIVVVAAIQRTLTRGVIVTAAIGAGLLIALVGWWRLDAASFARSGHYTATVAFFLLIAAVAVLAALRPCAATPRPRAGLRVVYIAVAAGIVAALAFLLAAVTGIAALPGAVLTGEAAALGLFAVFWLAQSVEFWNEVDPALRGPRRE
jgi:hypothetical protein